MQDGRQPEPYLHQSSTQDSTYEPAPLMPPKEEGPGWGNEDQAKEESLRLVEALSEVHPISSSSDSGTVEEHQAKT
eukprot:9476850-Pyramimonas_sp.AAC.1